MTEARDWIAIFSKYLPELLNAVTMQHPVTMRAMMKPARQFTPKNRPTSVGKAIAKTAGITEPLIELAEPESSSLLPVSLRATLEVTRTEPMIIPVITNALHAPASSPVNTLIFIISNA